MTTTRKYRSDVLLGITLVELLFVLLFVTLLCTALVKANEGKYQGEASFLTAENAKLQKQLERKEATIKEQEKDLMLKTKKIQDLEYQRQILVDSLNRLDRTLYAELPTGLKDIIKGHYPEVEVQAGGIGKPLCSVYEKFLFKITMYEDETLLIDCDWEADSYPELIKISAINKTYKELRGSRVHYKEFMRIFEGIKKYYEQESCQFKVEGFNETESSRVYTNMLTSLEVYFYVARR